MCRSILDHSWTIFPHIFYPQAESRWQTLSLELENLKSDVVSAEEAVAASKVAMNEATMDKNNCKIKVAEVKALYDAAKASLDRFEEQLTQCSTELSEIKREKSNMGKKVEACALEAKKLSVAISRIQKERQSAEKLVASLLKNHTWIESEKGAFGVEGGDYDFEAINPNEMSKQLHVLQAEQESLVSQCCHDMKKF